MTTTSPDPHAGHAYTAEPGQKEAILKRLRRIQGQLRGIEKMVENDTYCIDVLTQVSAVNAAMHKVSLALLEGHVGHCVVDAARQSAETGDPSIVDDKVKEVTQAIGRLLR
ncbi:MAG: metal-sensitive transcriptional regulator [Galactobacter sp.]